MKRISFKTWYGDMNEVKNIPPEHLKIKDKLIDKNTKKVFIYNEERKWVPKQYEEGLYFSPFFEKTFYVTEQVMNELLEIYQGTRITLTIKTKENQTIELTSLEGKILFNELF